MAPLSVTIIGAGIGGLVCAIACRREGLSARVLEQADEIKPVRRSGHPDPTKRKPRALQIRLLPSLQKIANEVKALKVRRYQDGSLLASRPVRWDTPWLVIHRADYHKVLMDEAQRLGAEIVLNAKVSNIDLYSGLVSVEDGTLYTSDVVVGADGLWSTTRSQLLGSSSDPVGTGDLAYRGTFTLEQLQQLNDPRITELCQESAVTVWFGPEKHCVFYPVRNGTQFNMVLLRPDDLPKGARTVQGDLEEMKNTFEGWDDVLTKIISCIPAVLKWKLMHHDELERWTKGRTVLLGDACHPTLPYQAQGAAMAVEDGAIIGSLLGRLSRHLTDHDSNQCSSSSLPQQNKLIHDVLALFEKCQKHRTTVNVQGAVDDRRFYHMPDGQEQRERDAELVRHTWTDEASKHLWMDMAYNRNLLGTDVLAAANAMFDDYVVGLDMADRGLAVHGVDEGRAMQVAVEPGS
ncbi:3-hydroxybenzoate 6-hydroxylase 1 [Cyphellophora attinorum]|uniref:3-hydroxybenzoate 6-hydroxylase 1 n=1 Tax=Cyphellophora attinorum TaxID=1664694 RepID=A0A0N1NX63_9EURO|nr:3-hydroxybenzoate 6-hydroxylase 1 [Phialophora attinorum]KPI37152.1 3-hydroxybenzoate 6-hydroxylase 1 [Phialophora attinorum]